LKFIGEILLRLSSLIKRMSKKLRHDQECLNLLDEWYILDKKNNFRTNYPAMNSNSIVFDLGGYRGQWSSDIYAKYKCKI